MTHASQYDVKTAVMSASKVPAVMNCPGGLKLPGWFVLREASVDMTRMGGVGFEQAGKMAPAASPERPAEMNLYLICIFNINKEGFNGVSSIKTDIYYSLGMLWFAATSIKRN